MEYNKREIIPFENKIITDSYIYITVESTLFTRRENKKLIEQKEFLDTAKKLRKLAKEKNVKITGINSLSKRLKENYGQYKKEILTYQDKFKKLGDGWKDHVLRMGITDDVYYREILQPLEFSLQKMGYGSTQIHKFNMDLRRMNELIKLLEEERLNSATV